MRAKRFIDRKIEEGILSQDTSEWPKHFSEKDAEILLGVVRIVDSTDGYIIERSKDNGLESQYYPLLPGEHERRALFDPTRGFALSTAWLKRIYRDVDSHAFEDAARSILYSDRETRLLLFLWTTNELVGGSYVRDMLDTRYEDFMAWLAADPELLASPDPLKTSLIDAVSLLEGAQRRIEQRCGDIGPVARKCRTRADYRFRAHLISLFGYRTSRLLDDVLPRLGLADRYPNPGCLDVVEMRGGSAWKECGASDEDRDFVENFFKVTPMPENYESADSFLSMPKVARVMLGRAKDEEAPEERALLPPIRLLLPRPPEVENEAAIRQALAAWNKDDPIRIAEFEATSSFAKGPAPSAVPTLRRTLLGNYARLARSPEGRAKIINIDDLLRRSDRIDGAMRQIWYEDVRRGVGIIIGGDSPEERLLASMRANARAERTLKEAFEGLEDLMGVRAYADAIRKRDALKSELLKAARALVGSYAGLLRGLLQDLPTQPEKWKPAFDQRVLPVAPEAAKFEELERTLATVAEQIKRTDAERERLLSKGTVEPALEDLKRKLSAVCGGVPREIETLYASSAGIGSLVNVLTTATQDAAKIKAFVGERQISGIAMEVDQFVALVSRLNAGKDVLFKLAKGYSVQSEKQCDDYSAGEFEGVKRKLQEKISVARGSFFAADDAGRRIIQDSLRRDATVLVAESEKKTKDAKDRFVKTLVDDADRTALALVKAYDDESKPLIAQINARLAIQLAGDEAEKNDLATKRKDAEAAKAEALKKAEADSEAKSAQIDVRRKKITSDEDEIERILGEAMTKAEAEPIATEKASAKKAAQEAYDKMIEKLKAQRVELEKEIEKEEASLGSAARRETKRLERESEI